MPPIVNGRAGASLAMARRLIDEGEIGRRQVLLFLLCCCVSMVEGFDLQAMALAAPEVKRAWGIASAAFGPVFSAGLFGGLLGGFAVGLAGQRLGPKPMLIASIALFGVLTLLTVGAATVSQFILLRLAAGVGLGAAVPGVVAIVASYAPARLRSTAVTVCVSCQLLGGVVGGAICAHTLPLYGWQSIFVIGGVGPLLLIPILAWRLPEALAFLGRQPAAEVRIAGALAMIGKIPISGIAPELGDAEVEGQGGFGQLMATGRRGGTLLLWSLCIVGAMLLYFMLNWLPTILRDQNATAAQATFGSVQLSAGGLVGALVMSRLMDRFNPYWTVMSGYLLASLALIGIALQQHLGPVTAILIVTTGIFGLGAQSCLVALIVGYYPPLLHNAAVGAALGFARVGAVVGPLLGSYILLRGGAGPQLFLFAAIVSAGAAIATAGMGSLVYWQERKKRSARSRVSEVATGAPGGARRGA